MYTFLIKTWFFKEIFTNLTLLFIEAMRSDDNSVSEAFDSMVCPKPLNNVQCHQSYFILIQRFTFFFLDFHTTPILEDVFIITIVFFLNDTLRYIIFLSSFPERYFLWYTTFYYCIFNKITTNNCVWPAICWEKIKCAIYHFNNLIFQLYNIIGIGL